MTNRRAFVNSCSASRPGLIVLVNCESTDNGFINMNHSETWPQYIFDDATASQPSANLCRNTFLFFRSEFWLYGFHLINSSITILIAKYISMQQLCKFNVFEILQNLKLQFMLLCLFLFQIFWSFLLTSIDLISVIQSSNVWKVDESMEPKSALFV